MPDNIVYLIAIWRERELYGALIPKRFTDASLPPSLAYQCSFILVLNLSNKTARVAKSTNPVRLDVSKNLDDVLPFPEEEISMAYLTLPIIDLWGQQALRKVDLKEQQGTIFKMATPTEKIKSVKQSVGILPEFLREKFYGPRQ